MNGIEGFLNKALASKLITEITFVEMEEIKMLKFLWKKIFKREEFKLPISVEMFYRRQKAYHIGSKNMFPNITEPQEVVNCLRDVFLGEDWYCVDPLCTGQINSIILDEILYYKCGKKYRKAINKIIKS